MQPEFMCDALDDLRDDEAELTDEAQWRVDLAIDEMDRAAETSAMSEVAQPATTDPLVGYDAVLAFYGIDPVALRTANPFAYLMLGQAYFADLARLQAITQTCMVGALAMARAASETRPYQPVPGARNKLRWTLHRTGVL